MSNISDKRNFCLMLSLPIGQHLAKIVGMVPPSPDVAERENEQINEQWSVLEAIGVFDEVYEAVEWFIEVLEMTTDGEEEPPTQQMIEGSKEVLLAFGMALTQKLFERNKIAFLAQDWMEDEDDE